MMMGRKWQRSAGGILVPGGGIPTDGLIAHYTMDNISGSTLVDEMGSYDLALSSGATTVGLIGDALYFTSSSGGATSSSFANLTELSVSTWVNVQSYNGLGYFIALGFLDNRVSIGISVLSETTIRLVGRQNTSDAFTEFDTAPYPSVGWHHFLLNDGPSGKEVYMDDTLIMSSTVVGNSGTPYISIGNNLNTSQNALGYEYDQVRIYNRARTSAERTALYNEV